MVKAQHRPLAMNMAQKNKMGIREAENFITLMFEVIHEGLEADKVIRVKGFGTFKLAVVKEREGVDVNTGERITIGGRERIVFTPDPILRDLVNKPFAQFETVVVNDGVDFTEIDKKFTDQEERDKEVKEEPMELIDFGEVASDELTGQQEESMSGSVVYPERVETAPEEKPVSRDVPETETDIPVEETSSHASGKEEPGELEPSLSETTLSEVDVPVVEDSWHSPGEEEPKGTTISLSETEQADTSLGGDVPSSSGESEKTGSSLGTETRMKGETPAAEDPGDQEKPEREMVSVIDVPISHDEKENPESAVEEEVKENRSVLRYIALIASAMSFVLLVCLGVLSFQYYKVVMQRNRLLMTTSTYDTPRPEDKEKRQAREDSLRMQAAASAIAKAEEITRKEEKRETGDKELSPATLKGEKTDKASSGSSVKEAANDAKPVAKDVSSSRYDADPRIRTGAYRIVGIAQTVKVKKGQTLSSISKAYLGPGMECYVEAVNGVKEVKEGQSLKIPALEWKKKR